MTPTPRVPAARPAPTKGEQRFWDLAEPLLHVAGVSRSTMMGYPCLRINGAFFACSDRRTGNLVVKLPERRVGELIDAGRAEPFAPSGRPFREWVSIGHEHSRSWPKSLDEAIAFVSASAPTKGRASR